MGQSATLIVNLDGDKSIDRHNFERNARMFMTELESVLKQIGQCCLKKSAVGSDEQRRVDGRDRQAATRRVCIESSGALCISDE